MSNLRSGALALALTLSAFALYGGNRSVDTPVRIVAGNTTQPAGIFAGDFTADGKQDVLLVEADVLRVIPGHGDGTFGTSIPTQIQGFVPEGVADFNRDGRPDVYLVAPGHVPVVMDGAANGTFGPLRAVDSTIHPRQLVAGDFTGDGLLDLGGVSDMPQNLAIYAGDGAGGFTQRTMIPLSIHPFVDAAAGDFDDDGRLDVVVTGYGSVHFLWNDGASFSTTTRENQGGLAVTAGDLNGDGITDAAAYGQGQALVWLGSASRNVTLTGVYVSSADGQQSQVGATLAHLDGDGRADLVVSSASGQMTVISHDGTSLRRPRSFRASAVGRAWIAAGDFTGDGKTDVVYVRGITTERFFSLLRGRGDGTFRAPVMLDLSAAFAPHYYTYVESKTWTADVTGDGRPDVVASLDGRSIFGVLPGQQDGSFGGPVFTAWPSDEETPIYDAGDLNGDGRNDFLRFSGNQNIPPGIEVYLGQSNGTFAAGPTTRLAATYSGDPSLHPIRDYTGDGHADLLGSDGSLFPGTGNGGFGVPIATGIGTGVDVLIGDVNGDELPDLAMSGNGGTIYINAGGGAFTARSPNPLTTTVRTLADLNGDRFADGVGSSIVLGNGDGTFTRRGFDTDFGTDDATGSALAIADVDGDGHADVASAEAIVFGTGDGAFDHAAQTAAGIGSVISTADYDVNGSPDVWSLSYQWLTIVPTRRGADGSRETQVSVATTPNPSPWGELVSVAANVTTTSSILPRGAVLYRDGTTPFAIRRVGDNGAATASRTAFPLGTTSANVTFTGDEHHGPASASTSHTTTQSPTTITVTTTRRTYEIGNAVIIRASLGRYATSATGTVTYRKGSTVLTTLSTKATQLFTSSDPALFPLGTHTITAEYSGDEHFLSSQSAPVPITMIKAVPTMTLTLPPSPIMTGRHTLTASFPNHPGVTGSVAFSCFSAHIGNVPIVNGQAVLTTNLSPGEGTCVASFPGNADFSPSSATMSATVYSGSMPSTPAIRATYTGNGSVWLFISPIKGATMYDVYRGVDGAPLSLFTSSGTANFTTPFDAPELTTVVYAVIARDTNGSATPMGPRDIAMNVGFVDDPIVAGVPVKAQHVVQLQSAINAVRRAAGLPLMTFNAPAAGMKITAARIYAMRNALGEARGVFGMATPLTDSTLTKVRGVHLQELRDGVR